MSKPFKIPQSVLVVIHTRELEVLLIKRTDAPDFWQSVTGAKDHADESFRHTAEREVLEETGIDCRCGTVLAGSLRDWELENDYEIYPRWQHRYAPGVRRNIEHLFGLTVAQAGPVALDPSEHNDSIWLPYRQAADQCYSPSNAEAILMLSRFLP